VKERSLKKMGEKKKRAPSVGSKKKEGLSLMRGFHRLFLGLGQPREAIFREGKENKRTTGVL